MFEGFAVRELETERGPIHARVGGTGPPLLLLHGYPQTHLTCEDYRAGATIDRQLDEADRGRLIDCPVLVLWGTHGALGLFYGDVLAVWQSWARDVRGRGVEASHFLVEDRPEEVAGELTDLFEGAAV
jgi:pimeloyl-ACP methyl ester carboxylesterase